MAWYKLQNPRDMFTLYESHKSGFLKIVDHI